MALRISLAAFTSEHLAGNPHWVGPFYPEHMLREEFLFYYAHLFSQKFLPLVAKEFTRMDTLVVFSDASRLTPKYLSP